MEAVDMLDPTVGTFGTLDAACAAACAQALDGRPRFIFAVIPTTSAPVYHEVHADPFVGTARGGHLVAFATWKPLEEGSAAYVL